MDDPFAVTGAETCELQDTPEGDQSHNYELVWRSAEGVEIKTFPDNIPNYDDWTTVSEWVEETLEEHGYTTVVINESDSPSITWRLLFRV